MVSHVDIIGALVFRTREAINVKNSKNSENGFYANALRHYKYHNILFDEPNKLHLWHFPGTQQEITEFFNKVSKDPQAANKLFPCVLNFQSVEETWGTGNNGLVQIDLDLAIGCVVDVQWTTEQRNRTVHKYVLEPIFDEFMNQIRSCGWFQLDMSGIDMRRMKVFTTGTSTHQALRTQYGWYFDTIQMTNLKLFLKPLECEGDRERIEKESELVTDSILYNGRTN